MYRDPDFETSSGRIGRNVMCKVKDDKDELYAKCWTYLNVQQGMKGIAKFEQVEQHAYDRNDDVTGTSIHLIEFEVTNE